MIISQYTANNNNGLCYSDAAIPDTRQLYLIFYICVKEEEKKIMLKGKK